MIDLREHLEDPWQHLGGDTDAAIPDPHGHTTVITLGGQPDVPTPLRVFGGIVQQVREDLRQASRVGDKRDRLLGQCDLELVSRLLDERSARLDGAGEDRRQLDRLRPQSDRFFRFKVRGLGFLTVLS